MRAIVDVAIFCIEARQSHGDVLQCWEMSMDALIERPVAMLLALESETIR